ncbi:sorting nexin-11 [Brachionichthys hirsutus]|uniref:sorting nexin-11 n=1 Tax=Brachionichthys hirsutus TaxID=412623 RepID=UPI003604378B
MNNQEDDEFIAVRVQDPRIQNEGSWNSYVDYKIFLHTNSKAFTAKTSCVRRRYSEFVWLKKKLQKNAGLVPVPALPCKSVFSFSNEDFLERRRKGLQVFLDKVLHMTVCLSDSQLHLFLQTQLPVGHIQDCVQGHTPYTVTDAILTYASSNQGFAQAQEEDAIKEPSLTVSYESMESPAPHQPFLQTKDIFRPDFLACGDSKPQRDPGTAELDQDQKIKVIQTSDHLEAVDYSAAEVSFYLGDSQDDSGSLSPAEPAQQRMETPVEVHNPMGADSDITDDVGGACEGGCSPTQESIRTSDTEEKAEEGAGSDSILDPLNSDSRSQDILEDVSSEMEVSENQVIPDVEGRDADAVCPEEIVNSDGQMEPDVESAETPSDSRIVEEAYDMPQTETGGGDTVQTTDLKQVGQDLVVIKNEMDEDSRSLPSSNESIVEVSDEESICDAASDLIQAENDDMNASCVGGPLGLEMEASTRNTSDLNVDGSPAGKDDFSGEDNRCMAEIDNLCKSLDLNSGADLTESDFNVLGTSGSL